MTENFQNISITLPKERMREHIFYSTAKNWNKEKNHALAFQNSKSSALREMSCTTQITRQNPNFGLDIDFKKLEQRLNEKNELLIKQSKWKNYYLKEEISVLLEQIMQHLDSILQNFKQDKDMKAYRNKLQKVINKVQSKRKSQANWIDYFGFSPKNQTPTIIQSESLKKQQQKQKTSEVKNQQNNFQPQFEKLKEENKRLIKSLNILTIQIQIKQNEVISLKGKYSKAKNKKQSLKNQLTELHKQYEILLHENPNIKDSIAQQKEPYFKSNHKNKHFHTYSLDRDFHSHNSNLFLPSQKKLKLGEDSQNLFTLSDTPFIGEKKKDIPVSLQFFQVRKKLLSSEKTNSQKQALKSFRNQYFIKSQQNKYLKEQSRNQRIKKKNSCFSDAKQRIINQNSYQPSCSIYQKKDSEQQNCYRYAILSQSLAIQKLLQRI